MIIAALALAIVIDSFVVKHVTGFRLGYFLPYAIPGVVASIIWVYLYNGQISPIVKGLAAIGVNVDFFNKNIVLGSMANITTWTFTGYNMLIFLAALQAIPHDLYEAARIDGANGWQIATKIKLPNVRGAALLAMLLSIVGTIQLFNEPQIMSTADPGISKSYTPMMMAMNTSQGTITPSGDGPASAIAIVMALDRRCACRAVHLGRKEGERVMSSATVEARARKKAERKLEKQRQAAQHDLPRSMRPSAAVKTFTVVLLVLVLIYFLFPIYWAIIASTKTPAQMTGSNGMWFAVPLDQLPNAIATNYSKLLGWTRGNFWRWVLNSLIYSGVSALIGTIVSVMAGYATANSTSAARTRPSASLWPACSCRPPC